MLTAFWGQHIENTGLGRTHTQILTGLAERANRAGLFVKKCCRSMHHKITVQDDETGPHPTDEGLSVSCLVVNWYVQSNGVLYMFATITIRYS